MISSPIDEPGCVKYVICEGDDDGKCHSSTSMISTVTTSSVKFIQNKCCCISNKFYQLKDWCCSTFAYNFVEERDVEYKNHRLQQQADAVSSARQERDNLTQSIPLDLRGKIGFIMGIGLLTGGVFVYNRYSAGKNNSLTRSADLPASSKLDFQHYHHHHESINAEYFIHIPPPLESANLVSETYQEVRQDVPASYFEKKNKNIGLTDYLIKQGVIDFAVNDRALTTEEFAGALSCHLFGESIRSNAKILQTARSILAEKDLYGGYDDEIISVDYAASVIRNHVFHKILNSSPGEYLAKQMALSDFPSSFTVKSIRRYLSLNKLRDEGLLNFTTMTEIQKSYFRDMWSSFIHKEIPVLGLAKESTDDIALDSVEFANLYAGSKFIKNIGMLKDYTQKEVFQTGIALWESVLNDSIEIDKIGYFIDPALFFLASNQPDIFTNTENIERSDIELLNMYIDYRDHALQIEKELTALSNNYQVAIKAWLTKGKLAEKIVEKCPQDTLPGIYGKYVAHLTTQERKKQAADRAKELYMNGFVKPCNDAPDNLNDEYHRLTTEVAESFAKIDRILIALAIANTDKNDKNFITSLNAAIRSVSFRMATTKPIAALPLTVDTNSLIDLKMTNLFSVTVAGQERIYALKNQVEAKSSEYKIIRVDRDIKKYITSGILNYDSFGSDCSLKTIMGLEHVICNERYRYSIFTNNHLIKKPDEELTSFINYCAELHRGTLYSHLYKSGNDLSNLETIWNGVKSFILFYDCVEAIVKQEPQQALIPCIIDITSLVPVIGKASSMSMKFGLGLAMGARKSGVALMHGSMKSVGRTLAREVRLPRVIDMVKLGKLTARAVDPGFELLTKSGMIFIGRIKPFLKKQKNGEQLIEKITSSKNLVKEFPSAEDIIPAYLSDAKITFMVKKIGQHGYYDVYAKVSPDSGQVFGNRYINPTLSRPKFMINDVGSSVNSMGNAGVGRQLQRRNDALSVPGDNDVINLAGIPLQRKFVGDFAIEPPSSLSSFVSHLKSDNTGWGTKIRNELERIYGTKDLYYFRYNDDINAIPERFIELREHIGTYKQEVDNAYRWVRNLEGEFSSTVVSSDFTKLEYVSENRIKCFLWRALKLDVIKDTDTRKIIEREAMLRMRHYIKSVKDYFDNEMNNIYFVSRAADTPQGERKILGFMYPGDTGKRTILLVDNQPPGTQLSLTVLHESTHHAGSLDVMASPAVVPNRDASSLMDEFELGLQNGNKKINVEKKFISAYKAEHPNVNLGEDAIKKLALNDPVLKVDLFLSNADYLAKFIFHLGESAYDVKRIYRRDKRDVTDVATETSREELLYKLIIERKMREANVSE